MSASTLYRPLHAGYPGEPHVHVYEPVIRRLPIYTGGYWEMLVGYRCACGRPRPTPAATFDAAAQLKAALRYVAQHVAQHYGASAWKPYGDASAYREGGTVAPSRPLGGGPDLG